MGGGLVVVIDHIKSRVSSQPILGKRRIVREDEKRTQAILIQLVADRVLVVRDGQHHVLAKKRTVVATAQMERRRVACSGNALRDLKISAA
ncbi:MAG TPA: hypothetical protein VK251_09530 [Steroidobacteraceae bacterium]|nr:hypothetical protein [Steroidobacteraceae bacterium]